MMKADDGPLLHQRIDVWLDIACLFKSRSEAQRACKGGKVDVNGTRATPHRDVRMGDEITITRPFGRRQRVVVRDIAARHVPKAVAHTLYDDRTPPPSPDELAWRQLERMARASWRRTAPERRERRLLRKLKGRDD